MRILHVITTLDVGGAEHLMVDLLPRLAFENNDVELLVFRNGQSGFYESLESTGIKIHVLSESRNVYHPSNLVKMIPFVSNYDIVHTHNTACQLYGAVARNLTKNKTKFITTEHNSTNRRRELKWFKPIDRWMYNQYDAIVCIADQTYENLVQYIGDCPRISTIYNGVDLSRFIRSIGNIKAKREFVITMVAAFRPQKDFDTLMYALKNLPSYYILWIVGGGDDQEGNRIKSCCHKLGIDDRVVFWGVRQDVPDILEKSDVIVLSSHWEGLSLSSIEGMASGRPFIASDVDGLHEIVDGAGVLFPEGDDLELSKKIQNLCEHPAEYQRIARQCQERARQYDISVMAKKYLKLYDELCDELHS